MWQSPISWLISVVATAVITHYFPQLWVWAKLRLKSGEKATSMTGCFSPEEESTQASGILDDEKTILNDPEDRDVPGDADAGHATRSPEADLVPPPVATASERTSKKKKGRTESRMYLYVQRTQRKNWFARYKDYKTVLFDTEEEAANALLAWLVQEFGDKAPKTLLRPTVVGQ